MSTQTEAAPRAAAQTNHLEGTHLAASACRTLCRCWIGEDPDGGACHAFNAYHIDSGTINGVDVSGLNYIQVVQIPGNVLVPKSWKRVTYVDAKATQEQRCGASSMRGTAALAARLATSTA